MTVIGLTGGIASGKSLASEHFDELGAQIINGDLLGHASYAPGTRGFDKVVTEFGEDIVGVNGEIDRAVFGPRIFASPDGLDKLNSIVWPEIRLLAEAEISRIKAEDNDVVIVLEAAVLIEADWQDLCDEVWVVNVPVDITRSRLMDRNNLDEASAQARIESQMSMEDREDFADVVIRNDSSVAEFNNRLEEAWISLLERVGA